MASPPQYTSALLLFHVVSWPMVEHEHLTALILLVELLVTISVTHSGQCDNV